MPTLPTIGFSSITGMTALSERPVYFLNLNHSPTPNLVVKGDAPGKTSGNEDVTTSIKWGSKLMKNVNNRLVNTKVMTDDETRAFKKAARLFLDEKSMGYANVDDRLPTPAMYVWVKMPFVDGLSDADYLGGGKWGYDPVVDKVRKVIKRMSDEQVWIDLGRIVAVDIFNGNCDRFDIHTGAWANRGNIMFLTGGQTSAIGLDTYDPNSRTSNLNTGGWHTVLLTLTNANRRRTFAEACVKGVGTLLKRDLLSANVKQFFIFTEGPDGKRGVKIPVDDTMDNLFRDYVDYYEQGLTAGAEALRMYLQSKYRKYNAPWQNPQAAQPLPRARAQLLGGQRGLVQQQQPPLVQAYQAPVQAQPLAGGKAIPEGVLERMSFLGWMV